MTTKGLRAIWQQRRNRQHETSAIGSAPFAAIGSRLSNLRGNVSNAMTLRDDGPQIGWTPDAIAAARMDTPLTDLERRAQSMFPPPYKLAGESPEPLHKDVARVMAVCASRGTTFTMLPGLAMETTTTSDRWYITFSEPDATHDEQWFFQASGGDGELFGPGELDEFLWRLDIPARSYRAEIRRGYRVLVFEDVGSFTRTTEVSC